MRQLLIHVRIEFFGACLDLRTKIPSNQSTFALAEVQFSLKRSLFVGSASKKCLDKNHNAAKLATDVRGQSPVFLNGENRATFLLLMYTQGPCLPAVMGYPAIIHPASSR